MHDTSSSTAEVSDLLARLLGIQRKSSPDDAPLLSRKEAAQYLGVSPRTLAFWATTKRYNLQFVKIGRLAKYRRSDLDAFVSARAVKS